MHGVNEPQVDAWAPREQPQEHSASARRSFARRTSHPRTRLVRLNCRGGRGWGGQSGEAAERQSTRRRARERCDRRCRIGKARLADRAADTTRESTFGFPTASRSSARTSAIGSSTFPEADFSGLPHGAAKPLHEMRDKCRNVFPALSECRYQEQVRGIGHKGRDDSIDVDTPCRDKVAFLRSTISILSAPELHLALYGLRTSASLPLPACRAVKRSPNSCIS